MLLKNIFWTTSIDIIPDSGGGCYHELTYNDMKKNTLEESKWQTFIMKYLAMYLKEYLYLIYYLISSDLMSAHSTCLDVSYIILIAYLFVSGRYMCLVKPIDG